MNSAAASPHPSQQSFKTLPTSQIDTFRRISLPVSAASVSYAVAGDSRSVLPTPANSSQSATAGYFQRSPGYLSPTGSIETMALHELQAFAGQGGMDHVSTQSPDTTDSAGSQGFTESSSICQPSSSVATDDSSCGLKESKSSSFLSICTMCGRGCGCQKQFEDAVYRQTSQDSQKVQSRSGMFDTHHCQCAPRSSSLSSSSSSSPQQQQQSQRDIMPHVDMFSMPLELSNTLRELSVLAREPPTGSTADLIEHTIQAVVDAHVNTCLYTLDKVATGLREYELMLSTKPPVSSSLYAITC